MELNFDDLEDAEALPDLEYRISNEDFYNLLELVTRTTLDIDQQNGMILRINNCESMEEFQSIRRNLLLNRIESKDRISLGLNYGMADITNTIRQMSKDMKKPQLKKL